MSLTGDDSRFTELHDSARNTAAPKTTVCAILFTFVLIPPLQPPEKDPFDAPGSPFYYELQVPDDARRDEDQQLIVRSSDVMSPEQRADDRNLMHEGQARSGVVLFRLVDTGDDRRPAVPHHQFRMGIARGQRRTGRPFD